MLILAFGFGLEMVLTLRDDVDDFAQGCPNRFQTNFKDIDTLCDKDLDHFITPQSINFFDRFNISKEFLDIDPTLWYQNGAYKHGLQIATKLRVVNDCAERGVCLMQQYNNILTKNEDQKQFILQIITEYRREYPDARKVTVCKDA